ncbi:MAG: Uma2 family endonuclease [Bryobacteraceae bacterium]|jgi:Uma2 family endonuclease
MKATMLVPVEEYLRTTYRPDCDYVDGEVLERNLGERDHSKLQREFILYFGTRAKRLGIQVFPEQRVQVSARRFRIPDVCVVVGREPEEQIFREPPFICIEILSKDDSLIRVQNRIDDYLKFGVPYVWVVDPTDRRAWTYSLEGSREVKDGVLRTENPSIEVLLAEVFAGLDDARS